MPKKLYKYVMFDGKELDEKKLTSLKNGEVWISSVAYLNDSEEFKKVIVNEKLDYKFNKEKWDDFISDIRNEYGVCSFSQLNYKSKYMWEKYGNDGNGFVIELDVINDACIHKVDYQVRQFEANEILKYIQDGLVKENGMIKSTSINNKKLVQDLRNKMLFCKENKWKLEKEWRVLQILDGKSGQNYKITDFGMRINRIIAGYNCSIDKINVLADISEALDCSPLMITTRNKDNIDIKEYLR